jgi:hypothetical protein
MDELVSRLSQGAHPVEVTLRPERTAAALKQRIDEFAYVHVKFTGTRGGTELGVGLDKELCNWRDADFDNGHGTLTLCGHLTLNYVPVRCIAEIDLATLSGTGYLQVIDAPAAATNA